MAAVVIRTQLYREPALFLEAGIYFGILWGVTRPNAVRQLIASLGPARRYTLFAAIGCVFAGQLADQPEHMYPFVSWTMYSNQTSTSPTYPHFQAVLADGREIDLPLHAVPAQGSSFATKFMGLAHQAQHANDPHSQEHRLLLATSEAVAKLHGQASPSMNRIERIRVYQASFSIDGSAAVPELVYEVSLD